MASASKAKKIGVSIIGLGWPGVEHLKGYRACDDCEVVALCDWDEALLAKVAGEYATTWTPSASACRTTSTRS